MGADSKIEWTNHTFNPWRGCTKVAEGCKHCYADTLSKRNPRTLGVWGPNGNRVVAAEMYWQAPQKWDRQAAADGVRRKVFCASLADVFEEWNGVVTGTDGYAFVPDEDDRNWPGADGLRRVSLHQVRLRLFTLIDATPHLDWLLVTKRPENIVRMWPQLDRGTPSFRRNVWLLTSVANQSDANRNIPYLLQCRDLSPVLGISAEPLLGPLNITRLSDDGRFASPGVDGLDWVIAGGESGPNARPMHPDWARSLQDQCSAAGVAFFFKQWGEWAPSEDHPKEPEHLYWYITTGSCQGMAHVGKKAAGRLLDGREWNEFPQSKVSV